MYKVVGVKFWDSYSKSYNDNGTEYYYKDFYNCNIGDLVVVDTPSSEYKVVKVVSTDVDTKLDIKKCIIQKIDFIPYNKKLEEEKNLSELKLKIDKKVKQLQELAVYEILSEKDDELKTLVSEYKNLLNTVNSNDISEHIHRINEDTY